MSKLNPNFERSLLKIIRDGGLNPSDFELIYLQPRSGLNSHFRIQHNQPSGFKKADAVLSFFEFYLHNPAWLAPSMHNYFVCSEPPPGRREEDLFTLNKNEPDWVSSPTGEDLLDRFADWIDFIRPLSEKELALIREAAYNVMNKISAEHAKSLGQKKDAELQIKSAMSRVTTVGRRVMRKFLVETIVGVVTTSLGISIQPSVISNMLNELIDGI